MNKTTKQILIIILLSLTTLSFLVTLITYNVRVDIPNYELKRETISYQEPSEPVWTHSFQWNMLGGFDNYVEVYPNKVYILNITIPSKSKLIEEAELRHGYINSKYIRIWFWGYIDPAYSTESFSISWYAKHYLTNNTCIIKESLFLETKTTWIEYDFYLEPKENQTTLKIIFKDLHTFIRYWTNEGFVDCVPEYFRLRIDSEIEYWSSKPETIEIQQEKLVISHYNCVYPLISYYVPFFCLTLFLLVMTIASMFIRINDESKEVSE